MRTPIHKGSTFVYLHSVFPYVVVMGMSYLMMKGVSPVACAVVATATFVFGAVMTRVVTIPQLAELAANSKEILSKRKPKQEALPMEQSE